MMFLDIEWMLLIYPIFGFVFYIGYQDRIIKTELSRQKICFFVLVS